MSVNSLNLSRKCSSLIRARYAIGNGSSMIRSQSSMTSPNTREIWRQHDAQDDEVSSSVLSHQMKKIMKKRIANSTSIALKDQQLIQREFSSVASAVNGHSKTVVDMSRKRVLNQDVLDIMNQNGSEVTLDELRELASQPCTPLSLSDMHKYASANANSKNYFPQRLRNAQFLHKELPIRVAQRAVDLLTLPHGLNKTAEVQEIAHKYLRYLKKIREFPVPQTEEEEYEFTEGLKEIVKDRKSIPVAIAKGVASLKDHRKEELDIYRLQEMEKALYRFFNARTGLRLLAEHHILSCVKRQHETNQSLVGWEECDEETDSNLGCIKDDCSPYDEAKKAAEKVMKSCTECYGISPEIEVLDCTPEKYADSNFTYVPHHLKYILTELLKNSCRATIRRHMDGIFMTEDHVGSHNEQDGVSTDKSLPSVRVVIARGAEDVTIKIADKGGGVPRSILDQMWTFAHSSKSLEVHSKENDTGFGTDQFGGGNVRGFGLPLARIYARYFGGELTLKSMEGYGVDAYLYLPVLGKECENLPKRVLESPGNLDSVHDGNHHVYFGDSFSTGFLSGEEPWAGGVRHYSSYTRIPMQKFNDIAMNKN